MVEVVSKNDSVSERKWSEDKCLRAVREYVVKCKSAECKPTIKGYCIYRNSEGGTPSLSTLKRLGSWQEVVRRSYVSEESLNDLKLPLLRKNWTSQECVRAFRAYLSQNEGDITARGYEQWRRRNDSPCYNTLRRHFGGIIDTFIRCQEDPEG